MPALPLRKQSDQPLYPDVLWSRPISKSAAGRLLVVGGSRDDFSQIQAVYQTALAAGAGDCKVAVPDSLRPLLAGAPDMHFVPSSSTGGLSRDAEAAIVRLAQDVTTVVIGPSWGTTSDGTILAENLLGRINCPVVLVSEGIIAVRHRPGAIAKRADSVIVATMQELFKLAGSLGVAVGLKPEAGVLNKVQIIQQLAAEGEASYLLAGREMTAVNGGDATLTTAVSSMDFFLPATYGVAAVFWMQNPGKPHAALTTAAYVLAKARSLITSGENDQPLLLDEICRAIRQAISQAESA